MIYAIVLFLSIVMTIMIKRVAIQDHPNERSSHEVAVPTGGGLSIVIAFYSGLTLMYLDGVVPENLFFALLGGIILAVVSFVDDIIELSPVLRLFTQLLSLMSAFYFLGVFETFQWWQSFLFVVGGLWFINLYNFLDGIDGYAGSEGIFVTLAGFLLYHDSVFIMMAIAIVGFLIFNWQKASIFMGDVGSTFLGFFFAVMMMYHYHDSSDLMIWFILLGLFIFDATITLFRRVIKKEKLSQAHKKHAFQRLVQSGFSHQKVVLSAMGINLSIFTMLWFVKESDYLILFFICYNILLVYLLKIIDDKRSFT